MAEMDLSTGNLASADQKRKKNPSNPRDFFAKLYESPTESPTKNNTILYPKVDISINEIRKRIPSDCDIIQEDDRNSVKTEHENSCSNNSDKSGASEEDTGTTANNNSLLFTKTLWGEKIVGACPTGAMLDDGKSKSVVLSNPVLANHLWSVASTGATSSSVRAATTAAALTGIQWSLFQQMSSGSTTTGDVNVPPALSSYRK